MRSRNSLLCFVFLFFFFISSAYSQPGYEALRARYLKLRNVDTAILKTDQWIALLADIESFVEKNPKNPHSPSLLYDASIVEEKLFERFKDRIRLRKACRLLERIAREYSGDRIADDALVRKGDLLLFLLKEKKEARFAYEEVVRAYSDSDMSPIARARLRRLDNGDLGDGDLEIYKKKKTEKKNENVPLIVLDPGHGGEDLGAQGLAGILEKDISLSVALLLEQKLKDQLGVNVLLTRRGDVFVPLSKRSSIANEAKADFFVSLHVNASVKKNVSGFEVYYLDNTNDVSAKKLAERENASSAFNRGGSVSPLQGDLQFMLSDLITDAKVKSSSLFAREVYNNTLSHLTSQGISIKPLGVKKALFYVLVGSHMPSVLVEMLFVDHEEDGKKLADPKFRDKFAQSLTYSIGQAIQRVEQ